MDKCLISLLLTISIISAGSAQWSIGGRFGETVGVTFKNYSLGRDLHFEALGLYNLDDNIDAFAATLLLEKYGPLSNDEKLGAFIGGGETMIFGDEFLFGLNAIIGFDWRIGRIGLQLDWMPTWILVNDNYFSAGNAAISARWVFREKFDPDR